MAKDIMQQSAGKTGTIISIPESIKKNLPSDFDIGAIGKIDLREAESIANEDILLIKESELIEDLDSFNIIPLKDDEKQSAAAGTSERYEIQKSALTAEIERIVDRIIKHEVNVETKLDELKAELGQELRQEQEPEPGPEKITKKEPEFDDGRKWISLEELEKYDEHGHRWVPLEDLLREDEGRDGNIRNLESREKAPEKIESAEEPAKKTAMVDGYNEITNEYVIWDKPSESKDEKKSARPAGKEKPHSAAEDKKPERPSGGKSNAAHEDEVVISMEDLEGPAKQRKKTVEDLAPIEYSETISPAAQDVAIIGKPERVTDESKIQHYRDLVSSGMVSESRETGKVYFIDDSTNGQVREDKSIFDESELDKIIAGIVQVDEGSAYMLGEANIDEDRERIAVITDEFAPVHEEFFVDLEYKYSDEELDYIHTAIVEEDYSSYIREIDDFFGIPGGRTIPAAVELLGLTADEFDTIEDTLFQDEFKDIHLYDRYHLYEFDRSAREGMARDRKSCRYLLPEENSLLDFERDSIESDVSSASALIFEEDIRDITEQLIKRTGKTEDEIRNLVERTFGIESLMESGAEEDHERADGGMQPGAAADEARIPDGITDITDRVVILDNEADVDRFVREFPPAKQMNIKMLLKYLDGLFETLPEEIIKKFASSEYFELYLKVLNELGV